MNLKKTFPDGSIIDCRDFSNGYVLEMQIVNQCNLNCYGCNHFSPIVENKYLSIEDFEGQIQLLFQKLPQLKRFVFIGGEPFLHPQLIDLIKVFKQYFPNTEIDVITNGLILKKLSLSEIEQYNQYNVKISVSIYQDFISKTDYEILSNKFNNIQFFNRPIFYHFTIDKTASQKSFFERKDCVLVTIPCFTLLNYKIYICPFSAYLQFCDNDIKNYNFLDLMEDINFNDLIKFCNCEKQICKYCKFDCPVLWNLSDRCKEEYFQDSKYLYLHNYGKYSSIYNNIDLYYKNFNFQIGIQEPFSEDYQHYLKLRFEASKIDILIPYYKVSIEQIQILKDNLENQSFINNCCVYFISDNSPDEEIVWDTFHNSILNTVFLKNNQRQGPGIARQIGIDNSYGQYFFFLDIDDLLIDYNALKKLYNIAKQKDLDLAYGDVIIYDILNHNFAPHMNMGYLYKRDYIIKNNIKNIQSFYGEDDYWLMQIRYYKPREFKINTKIYLYVYNIYNFHRQETSPIEKKEVLILLKVLFVLQHQFINTDNIIRDIKQLLEDDTVKLTDQFKLCVYNFLNQSNINIKIFQEECQKLSKICPELEGKIINELTF